MKETYWGYWMILLGVFVIVIMMLVSNITTQNTEDYYIIKEVTEAAMIDAVNYGYYRKYGELKIDREKFMESFIRRFAENVSLNTYEISFYDIYEAPPKVSVKVTSKSRSFIIAGDSTTFDIVNKIDAVLELTGQDESSPSYTSGSTNNNTSSNNSNEGSNNVKKSYVVTFKTKDGKVLDSKNVKPNQLLKDVSINYSTRGEFHCWLDENSNDCFGENRRITNDLTLVETNIPPGSSILGFIVAVVPDDYYVCNNGASSVKNCKYGSTLKSEYLQNKELLINQILKHWQEYYKITFTPQEKEEFLKNARSEFMN